MKIKNLLLLGLLAVYGMNAFAVDYKSNGIIYDIAGDGKTATVKGISAGMQDATANSITIHPTFVDGDGNTVKVSGFTAGWESLAGEKDITALTTSLSIDVTNFTALLAADVFDNFTKLKTVTLTGTSTIDGAYTVNKFTFTGGVDAAGVKLDLSSLSAKAGKDLKLADYSNDANVSELVAPEGIKDVKFKGSTKIAKVSGLKTIVDNAFEGCTALTSFTFATGASIGKEAFKGCTGLKGIDLAEVKQIGQSAFEGCTNAAFTSLTIPGSIEQGKIGDDAFKGMTALTTVTIENNNLETIGAWFFGDNKINSVTITSTSVTKIAASAFEDAIVATDKLNITAEKLTTIEADAFKNSVFTKLNLNNCPALAEISSGGTAAFPARAYTEVQLAATQITDEDDFAALIANSAASLTKVGMPIKMKKIADNTFKNFTQLKAVALSKKLETIGKNAFEGVVLLESITFPAKLETIDNEAFKGCVKLATIDFSQAAALKEIGTNAFDGALITKIDLSACVALEDVTATSFPQNNYTSIKLGGTLLEDADVANVKGWFDETPDAELKSCLTTLKEVTLPAGTNTIPDNMFKGFEGLTSISLPKAVTKIGKNAFDGAGLTAIKIREKVATIDDAAFKNCKALATANFTEATALEKINANAFEGTAIAAVAIPANANEDPLTIGAAAFKDCKKLKSISAKSWTGAIDDNTFEGCIKLTGIVVNTTINKIGDAAFKGCKALATVTFKYADSDAGLAAGIGASAFEGCAALAALDLSNTKLAALDQADIFKGCTSLAEITFPEVLTALGDGAGAADNLFSDCPIENLDASNVEVSDILFGTYWDETTLSYKPRDAKNVNTTLKTVKIKGEVPSNCFAYCTALESVEYFDLGPGFFGASDVDANAFEHCTGLKTFTYNPEKPVDVLVIDVDAFHGCVPFVQFVTNNIYMDCVAAQNSKAPVNTTFGDAEITTVKTVQDKANANQFVAKYVNNSAFPVYIDAADAKVYSIYVDGENAFFQALRTYGGKYYINSGANNHVIIKTEEEKEVSINPDPAYLGAGSVGFDDIYDSQEGDDLAAVQDGVNNGLGLSAGEYLYRLTNTSGQGFGFTFFNGTTIKAGQFFVACSKKPEGAGRLNVVWLDENGNVENETTGIETIENNDAANNGDIFNMQGVRVQKAQKGIYIQNGKKIVVK